MAILRFCQLKHDASQLELKKYAQKWAPGFKLSFGTNYRPVALIIFELGPIM